MVKLEEDPHHPANGERQGRSWIAAVVLIPLALTAVFWFCPLMVSNGCLSSFYLGKVHCKGIFDQGLNVRVQRNRYSVILKVGDLGFGSYAEW